MDIRPRIRKLPARILPLQDMKGRKAIRRIISQHQLNLLASNLVHRKKHRWIIRARPLKFDTVGIRQQCSHPKMRKGYIDRSRRSRTNNKTARLIGCTRWNRLAGRNLKRRRGTNLMKHNLPAA